MRFWNKELRLGPITLRTTRYAEHEATFYFVEFQFARRGETQ